jgi:C1A family cysteine protease
MWFLRYGFPLFLSEIRLLITKPGKAENGLRVGNQISNLMNRTALYYGWKPDLPDYRDFKYAASRTVLAQLPPKVDLTGNCPPVYDQGELGSCTANAIAGAFQFELMKQNATVFMPSRLFIYYNERVIENTVHSDSGAQIRDGMNTVSNTGVCSEIEWPYVINEFSQKPFATCYQDALTHLVTSFHSVNRDINQMKGCLAEGYPFVLGFTVYQAFESQQVAQSGVLNLPQSGEAVMGGHAVLAVGYDDSQSRFIIRNSWGSDWGTSGYFTMPYDYLLNENLSSDFWTIRLVAQ